MGSEHFFQGLPARISHFASPLLYVLKQSPFAVQAIRIAGMQQLFSGVVTLIQAGKCFQMFYSNHFMVPKPIEELRPILNLTCLNVFLPIQRFHMENVRLVIVSLLQGDFLAPMDIKDAYLHIPHFSTKPLLSEFCNG